MGNVNYYQVQAGRTDQTTGGLRTFVSSINLYDTGDEAPIDPFRATVDFPVAAGRNSYEAYLRFKIDHPGATAALPVTDIRIYCDSTLPTGVTLKFKGAWSAGTPSVFATPIKTTSSLAATTVPAAFPAATNVSVGNTTSYSIAEGKLTDFVIIQVQCTSAVASATTTPTLTLTYAYNSNVYYRTIPMSFSAMASTNPLTLDIDGIFVDIIDINGVLFEG
jgi:hypothetical protein